MTTYNENKNCSLYLGVHVAERVLSYIFKNVQKMPMKNQGYDFVCGKGFKIDVKSGVLQYKKDGSVIWYFHTKKNIIADYFLFIAFDNRTDLNPCHIWLIEGNEPVYVPPSKRLRRPCDVTAIVIYNTPKSLNAYKSYELTNKLNEVISCCNIFKKSSSIQS